MKFQIRNYAILLTLLMAFTCQGQINLDFSKKRGFNDSPFNLTITSNDPLVTIRYTLDGEEPSTTNTYLFLNDVIKQPKTITGWPNNLYNLGAGGTAQHDYEMDSNIVYSPQYSADIINGLKDIPSLSIVMPKADFWTMYDGTAELKTSVELLYAANSSMNEQVDGGIEPHSHKRLKRSMRLSFKNQYGTAKWESDIFKNAILGSDNATDEFDRIVLRGGNNRAWSRNWNEDRTAFTRCTLICQWIVLGDL